MWLLFGIAAIITAVLNLIWIARHRDPKWFRFISLALTAFTLCAFLGQVDQWVIAEDWSALADVLPAATRIFGILTAASVIFNGISLFSSNHKAQER